MGSHPFSELVLLGHEDAKLTRSITETDLEAKRLLRVALNGPTKTNLIELHRGKASEGIVVGAELYRGYTKHPLTRKLRNHIKRRLARDLAFFLYAVDKLGYTAPLVRAGIEHHWVALSDAPITSDAYLVLTDLYGAWKALDRKSRRVVAHLAAGFTPVELGQRLGVEGPPAVNAAMVKMSNHLEGR